jgi:prepilin-type N-terminal cleavage/methylation domain-containing protein
MERNLGARRGFTLIELVVVICLLALMVGAAVPLFQSVLLKRRSESVGDEVVMTLRLANQKSVFQQLNHDVVIDFTHSKYWLEFLQPRKHSKRLKMQSDQIRPLTGDFEFLSVYFPDQGESENRRKVRIPFYPDGTAKDAIILLGRRGESGGDYSSTIVIEIRGSDARVRILNEEERREYEYLL